MQHRHDVLILGSGLAALTTAPPVEVPADPALRSMLAHALPPPAATIAAFTDEFAPVDRYLGAARP